LLRKLAVALETEMDSLFVTPAPAAEHVTNVAQIAAHFVRLTNTNVVEWHYVAPMATIHMRTRQSRVTLTRKKKSE
jgi:putative NADH-flavin reductase